MPAFIAQIVPPGQLTNAIAVSSGTSQMASIIGPAAIGALLILLLGFGAVAADALPLQRVPLLCSIATVPLALEIGAFVAVSLSVVGLLNLFPA